MNGKKFKLPVFYIRIGDLIIDEIELNDANLKKDMRSYRIFLFGMSACALYLLLSLAGYSIVGAVIFFIMLFLIIRFTRPRGILYLLSDVVILRHAGVKIPFPRKDILSIQKDGQCLKFLFRVPIQGQLSVQLKFRNNDLIELFTNSFNNTRV